MLDGHVLDHVTTTLPGLHLVEQLLATIDYADAVRSVDFVAAENEEVGTQLLYIHWRVGNGLRSVYQNRNLM